MGDYHEVPFILEYTLAIDYTRPKELSPSPPSASATILEERVTSLHLAIFFISSAFFPNKSSKFSIWVVVATNTNMLTLSSSIFIYHFLILMDIP